MAAVTLDIETEQGATFTLGFVYHSPTIVNGEVVLDDDDNPVPGAAMNLAGATARMQIKAKLKDEVALVTATSQSFSSFPDQGGRILLQAGGVTGRIDVILTDVDTDAINVLKAVYDLELEWPLVNGQIRPRVDRILQGAVQNTLNVTKVDT